MPAGTAPPVRRVVAPRPAPPPRPVAPLSERAKYVTLGPLTEDNLRIIKDGLSPDDRVVVNGLMRARPGQKVTPKEEGATPAAGQQAKS